MTTRLWHPFADMGAVRSAEFVVTRGEDVWVWDADGRRYLDATASLWYANVGHGRREIKEAVARQMDEIAAYSAFGDSVTPAAQELAARLTLNAPMPGARVFLGSGGGDAVDTAAKLARRYWAATGAPERTHIISRTASYHGSHGFGTAIGGIQPNRDGFGDLIADTSRVAFDSVAELEAEVERLGPERTAAFFIEPVIGAGGVHPPPEGYIEAVAEVCGRTGILLVVDSVICAFGRLGTWFGIERWDVEPDMITFAKGVTSGYLPLGGVLVSEPISDPFWERPGGPVFRHGATYAAHATCCAAALANLDILEGEGLIARGRELEAELLSALAPIADHPLARSARGGVGMLAALELDPTLSPLEVARRTRTHGVIVRALGSSIAVSPPLTATPAHFELITDALSRALDELLLAFPEAGSRVATRG